MSHIQQVKTIQMVTRAKVMQLLGWDDLQYGNYVMEQAYAYLDAQMDGDVWGKDELLQCTLFWNWWKNHWHKSDMEFCYVVKQMPSLPINLVDAYKLLHDTSAFLFTPHSVVMDDAYAKLIYNITHSKEAKHA